MMDKQILALLKVCGILSRNHDHNVLIQDDTVGQSLDILSDTILDLLGIPPDETVEKKDGYCRDEFYFLFDEGEPEEILEKIKQLKGE